MKEGVKVDLLKIINFLEETTRALWEITRWRDISRLNPRETVLEHSFKATLLALLVIILEKEFSNREFDDFSVLRAVLIHDLAEGKIGDVVGPVKSDKRIREILKTLEKEEFEKMISFLPFPVKTELQRVYFIQFNKESIEGRLFEAIELIGYVMYALYWWQKGNHHPQFLKVLVHQSKRLKELSQEFVSVQIFYQAIQKELKKLGIKGDY